jgi:MFS family permease
MPRVPTPSPIRLAAPVAKVRKAAEQRLGAQASANGDLVVGDNPDGGPGISLALRFEPDGDAGTIVDIEQRTETGAPFFGWFIRPLLRLGARRSSAYAIAMLRSELEGGPEPAPPKPFPELPPVPFTAEQTTLLATAAAAAAIVAFASALFGQFADPISKTFHAGNLGTSAVFAVTRVGAIVALPATAIADRRGRRPLILVGIAASAAACLISGVAPNIAIFTAGQILQRAAVFTTATVAAIAVIEEAPEGARAYSLSMLALAGGLGFSLSVVLLPLADIGNNGWRIPFALGACTVLLIPRISRKLIETKRYEAIAARADIARGRVREIAHVAYRRRFVLLGFAAFLTSVFSAPSSSLMNKYLTDVHGFSNSSIAVFRTITTGIPGLVGLILGGRLAEQRGRRPIAAIGLAIATATQMVFFVTAGPVLWVMAAASILAAGASGIAVGSLEVELFPTEVRSTSNALLVVIGVTGSVTGLLIAGGLSNAMGGIGRSIALTGIGALIAAIFVIPRLPESGARALDDVSPTEEYGPGS